MTLPLLSRALDALLPPRCMACGTLVDAPGRLCADCWGAADFLAPPLCAACGLPFELAEEAGDGCLCGACLRAPPPFARARAVLRYGGPAREMVLAFKHADRTEMAPAFALWMARSGAELLGEAEVVVPVPLHWRRLFLRRYNQSAMLAVALGRLSGLPTAVSALARGRYTPSQGSRGRAARARNVRGAFAVPERQRHLVAGRRVLLVDDVLTSGATVGECARVLRRAGAESVDVLTLARVVLAE